MERKKMAIIFKIVNLWLCQMMYLVGGGTLIENPENYNLIAILGFALIQLARHPHLIDLSGLRNHMKEASGLVGFSSLWKIGRVYSKVNFFSSWLRLMVTMVWCVGVDVGPVDIGLNIQYSSIGIVPPIIYCWWWCWMTLMLLFNRWDLADVAVVWY